MPDHLNWLNCLLLLGALLEAVLSQQYPNPHRCSNRLENALEHMRRRSVQGKGSGGAPVRSRSMWQQPYPSPYQLYNSFYGQHSEPEDDFYSGGGNYRGGYYGKRIRRQGHPYGYGDTAGGGSASGSALELEQLLSSHRQPHKLAISRVEVEDLKVRVPPAKAASRWVEIDKCKFSTENSTLDTRLIFPDLTLSGKVVLQPTGGRCNMILRMRHAGIEFRTVPLSSTSSAASYEQSRRLGAASVRTDSHFAEPGFISVFAHGCQGPSGIRLRQNSKRRFGAAPQVELSEPHVILGTAGKYPKPDYDIRLEQTTQRDQSLNFDSNESDFFDVNGDNFYRRRQLDKRRRRRRRYATPADYADEMHFNQDILHFEDEQLQQLVEPDARAFADIFGGGNNPEELVGDAMSNELEKLFSMGVRGLLTTYMQRALQPAIKETLMENMGYTLSYG
ncbi:CG13634 [Drosophila busckii]|uniref:CG13634 n=1 Tax=Drosophila busckii TaxID=30019 RepID=A0A0M4EPF6_DROBS|nr:uncharacterized protein LOC108601236 [Drosophila busckii]ALC47665.1 CG13634 [Drosophila busckii]